MARSPGARSALLLVGRLTAALALATGIVLGGSLPVRAEGLQLTATPLLGGHVRAGAWAAVRVDIVNDGPDMRGELRVRTTQQTNSIYGVEADLPSGARSKFVLYALPAHFGSRLRVELVSGDAAVASADVPIRARDVTVPLVGVVAERPEAFQRDIEDALRSPNFANPVVARLHPEDLPTRVEAWAALDRLVWQDTDTGALSAEQLAAMELWLGAGGQLVVLGGSTGPATLRALPADLLPFTPDRTVDVSTEDLADLLGNLPAGASSLPALGGTLRQGAVLGRSGDAIYAARLSHGQGSVTLVGIDPGAGWLARSDTAGTLWRRVLPLGQGQFVSPFYVPDEQSIFQNALYNLPSVDLPPIEQLFVLLLAYIVLIGPVNYLVLRRLDRREWAWLTMPLLVGVFAVGSYGLGAALKGSDVIVNEIAIVRVGQQSERGIGQVYVGIFSPSRRTFDVRIPGGALLTSPSSGNVFGATEQPIDALIGDGTSRLRNFEVGFGVIRGFRADAAVDAPSLTAELRLVSGRIEGSVTNSSDSELEHLALVFGGNVATIPTIAPGETKQVSMTVQSANYYVLSERIFGTSFSREPAVQRTLNTRRAVIDQISGYGPTLLGASPDVPLLLAWRNGVALDVELAGERPNRVGDSLYVMPVGVSYDRQAVFSDSLIVSTVVEQGSEQGWGERNNYAIERGTMVLEMRPAGLAGRFDVTGLELAVTQSGFFRLGGNGTFVAPLPDGEQPDQDDPLGPPPEGTNGGEKPPIVVDPVEPAPGGGGDIDRPAPEPFPMGGLPAVQLFDHRAGLWYEFPAFDDTRAVQIEEPGRWIDESGRLLLRFVNRSFAGDIKWFQVGARMEGTIR